ncbi:MAG: hypothetical protein PHG85_00230 [Candidatus Altiarchaeota archaeon]|nr:hypothetical protein [Candidatus Altiarchaeota archaeon]
MNNKQSNTKGKEEDKYSILAILVGVALTYFIFLSGLFSYYIEKDLGGLIDVFPGNLVGIIFSFSFLISLITDYNFNRILKRAIVGGILSCFMTSFVWSLIVLISLGNIMR